MRPSIRPRIRPHIAARFLLLLTVALGALEWSGLLPETLSTATKVAMACCALASVVAFLVALISFRR